MSGKLFPRLKYVSVIVLLLITVTLSVPQALATIDTFPTINSITVNPASIDLVCTDPIVSGGTIITGNVLDIDDGSLFDSIDLTTSGLVCDGLTLNNISTASLTDFTTYNVRLSVSTNDSGDSIITDSFTLAGILVLDNFPPGVYTIQFRDISVTDDIGPSMDVPELFPSESGTLTVTYHNANVDVDMAETITVQINGIDVVLSETDKNTGIFQGSFTAVDADDAISYDPGTPGLARATITLELALTPTDVDVGLPLVAFASDEKHEDSGANLNVFDVGEIIYQDVDVDGTVSINDIRLANAGILGLPDGSAVNPGDPEDGLGLPLVAFTSDEKHEDSGANLNVFDVGEIIYQDADASDTATAGDTRLANAVSQGYSDGSAVNPGDLDGLGDIIVQDVLLSDSEIGGSLAFTPVTHPVSISFADGGMLAAGTEVFVTMSWADADLGPLDDPSLLKMFYKEPGFGYDIVTISSDADSHDTVVKTVSSDPTTAGFCGGFCLPREGNYVLGWDVGSGGGGGVGLTKGGFVVNALGFVKTLGGGTEGGGGNHGSPSVFGQSSFAILDGDQEGAGGILSDNNANTLEQTKTFNVGQKAILRFDLTEDEGIGNIDHLTLYTNIRDGQNRKDSDTFISYEARNTPTLSIHDPNGLFSQTKFDILQKDARHFVLKYELTFAKPMAKSDIILDSWNLQRWATTNKIPNAIEVVSSGIVQEQTIPAKTTFTEDITNDKVIPVWVKTNAKWWADGTLDNKNFISGIEYLVNEGIIKVSTTGTSNSPTISEIQPWIKSTAGWWADDKISEDEFVTAIEWLITNNIIQVAA